MEAGCFGGAVSRGGKKTKKTFADKKKVFTFADPNGKAGRGSFPGSFFRGLPERAAEKNLSEKCLWGIKKELPLRPGSAGRKKKNTRRGSCLKGAARHRKFFEVLWKNK